MAQRKRLRKVRLSDVPLEIRCRAAMRLADGVDERGRLELLAAAIRPSDRDYWVPVKDAA